MERAVGRVLSRRVIICPPHGRLLRKRGTKPAPPFPLSRAFTTTGASSPRHGRKWFLVARSINAGTTAFFQRKGTGRAQILCAVHEHGDTAPCNQAYIAEQAIAFRRTTRYLVQQGAHVAVPLQG